MKRKWVHIDWMKLLQIGSGLLIASLIFGGFVILYKNDNWLGISALATLILALGAFWAIWENHRMRAGDIDRDYRRRSLEDIRRWAQAAISSSTLFKFNDARKRQEIRIAIDNLIAEKDAIIGDVKVFEGVTGGEELKSAVENAFISLETYPDPDPRSGSSWEEHNTKLSEVMKAIFKVKAELKL